MNELKLLNNIELELCSSVKITNLMYIENWLLETWTNVVDDSIVDYTYDWMLNAWKWQWKEKVNAQSSLVSSLPKERKNGKKLLKFNARD